MSHYTPSGYPPPAADLESEPLRDEFSLIGNAFSSLEADMGSAPKWCGTAGGSANAVTLSPAPPITSYTAGLTVMFTAGLSNTGPATLAVSGLTTKALQVNGAALRPNAILGGATYLATYVAAGTFQLNRQQTGLDFSSLRALVNGETLGAPDWGIGLFYNSASAATITLPAANSAPAGSTICLSNLGAGTLTINRSGTSTIFAKGESGISVVLYQGQSLVLMTNGVTNGDFIQAAGPQKYTRLLNQNGYEINADGLIRQWGSDIRATVSGTSYNITLPIAFPNTTYQAIACNGDTGANPTGIVGVQGVGGSLTTITCKNNVSGSFHTRWEAIGR